MGLRGVCMQNGAWGMLAADLPESDQLRYRLMASPQ